MADFAVNGIKLDGIYYRVKVTFKSLKRSFSLMEGNNKGVALSARTIRDILGTQYSYSMNVEPDDANPTEYDDFFDAISSPVNYHTISLPYGQTEIVFEAQITSGSDTYRGNMGGYERWGGMTVNFNPMEPQRRPNE